MISQTSARILETSRRLFNEHGYHQVTMRQIAEALEISPGNLTYYFKHKSDIVSALMNESFDQTYLKEPILTLDDLLSQFRRMLETIKRNAFYFLDPEFFSASVPHNTLIRQRIQQGFAYLVETGVFDKSFTPDIQQTVLTVLLMSHMTWVRSATRSDHAMSMDEFIDAHLTLLKPYLTK